jgi:hypothetical protein
LRPFIYLTIKMFTNINPFLLSNLVYLSNKILTIGK